MDCGLCGGCSLRHLDEESYRSQKKLLVQKTLQSITRQNFLFSEPVFVADGCRRRASFAFRRQKGQTTFGFNAFHSDKIVDLDVCPQLTPGINRALPLLRSLLEDLCRSPMTIREKRKIRTCYIDKGDLWVTEADNGLDVVLEYALPPDLAQREIIFEHLHAAENVIRVSHRPSATAAAETIIEKTPPFIKAGSRVIHIPPAAFLQPSREGQEALTALVQKYVGTKAENVADLFCGCGTFSFPLAETAGRKVFAVDSAAPLLSALQKSADRQMVANVEGVVRNLFKQPLTAAELKNFSTVVLDPPRAGAKEQVRALATAPAGGRPPRVVVVSCNPASFVRDANILQDGGYVLREVTMVDQFVRTPHAELVALFAEDVQ